VTDPADFGAADAAHALARPELLVIAELDANWHGDRHWLVADSTSSQRFSLRALRLGRTIRWEEGRAYDLSVLTAQLDAADAFGRAGFPFMARAGGPVIAGEWMVVLYGWLAGTVAVEATERRAFAVGRLLRRMHELQLSVDEHLPVHDLVAGAELSIDRLEGVAGSSFLARAWDVVGRARRAARRAVVVHGDCNFPNLLWNDDRVIGIVDFDQIGACDPTEELAWVLKWWSRRGRIGTLVHDRSLASAVLGGYGEVGEGRDVLAAQLWITGCLNANSVVRVLRCEPGERAALIAELERRADELAALV